MTGLDLATGTPHLVNGADVYQAIINVSRVWCTSHLEDLSYSSIDIACSQNAAPKKRRGNKQ